MLLTRGGQSLPNAGWADRVATAAAGAAAGAAMPAATILVRPDGYVAWASDETAAPALAAAVREQLTRSCGPPEPTA